MLCSNLKVAHCQLFHVSLVHVSMINACVRPRCKFCRWIQKRRGVCFETSFHQVFDWVKCMSHSIARDDTCIRSKSLGEVDSFLELRVCSIVREKVPQHYKYCHKNQKARYLRSFIRRIFSRTQGVLYWGEKVPQHCKCRIHCHKNQKERYLRSFVRENLF